MKMRGNMYIKINPGYTKKLNIIMSTTGHKKR